MRICSNKISKTVTEIPPIMTRRPPTTARAMRQHFMLQQFFLPICDENKQKLKPCHKKNQIFIILAVLHRSAYNERRGPSLQFTGLATQFRKNIGAVASRWRHCVRFDRPRNGCPALRHQKRCFQPLHHPAGIKQKVNIKFRKIC